MYADDILPYKSINCLEDYRGLREDIDVIYECTSACQLHYLIASRKQQPNLTLGGLLLGDYTMEQFDIYRYLGVLLYRQFSTWADIKTLGCLYLTCIRP